MSVALPIEDTCQGIRREVNFDLDISHFIFIAVGLDAGLEFGHGSASDHHTRTLPFSGKLKNQVPLGPLWQGLQYVV